jgi:hypothetical protein
MKIGKLLAHTNVEGVFVHRRQPPSSSRHVTSPLWWGGVSIACHPPTGGRIAIAPPAASTATNFVTIFGIVSILKNLLLLMFLVALRLALMLVAIISCKLGMMFLELAIPLRHHVVPSHLLEM